MILRMALQVDRTTTVVVALQLNILTYVSGGFVGVAGGRVVEAPRLLRPPDMDGASSTAPVAFQLANVRILPKPRLGFHRPGCLNCFIKALHGAAEVEFGVPSVIHPRASVVLRNDTGIV